MVRSFGNTSILPPSDRSFCRKASLVIQRTQQFVIVGIRSKRLPPPCGNVAVAFEQQQTAFRRTPGKAAGRALP